MQINERRRDRLKQDLMAEGMSEREAYHRAGGFLRTVKKQQRSDT